jgi:hypothetical protein
MSICCFHLDEFLRLCGAATSPCALGRTPRQVLTHARRASLRRRSDRCRMVR